MDNSIIWIVIDRPILYQAQPAGAYQAQSADAYQAQSADAYQAQLADVYQASPPDVYQLELLRDKDVARFLQPTVLEETYYLMERIHMNNLQDLIYRLRAGESERRTARDLKMSRPTVHKYKLWAQEQGYLDPEQPLPELATLLAALGPVPQPPQMRSTLAPYQEVIEQLLDQGVEMTAIWQRLQENYGYGGSYSSVRRFAHRLRPVEPEAFVRVHTAPGEELQVDFATIGPLFDPLSGRPRPAYVFVATLSYSRHQYAELVFDQKVPTWLALHRHAIENFGGVPKRVVPDNLKAAVRKALVHDPVLGEAYRRLALHYGFLISPTVRRTPRHKGKVESGVHYVQRNFLAGQEFVDINAANQRLWAWVREVAGTRTHGTTRQAPLQLFHDYEQAALQPLPATPFSLHQTPALAAQVQVSSRSKCIRTATWFWMAATTRPLIATSVKSSRPMSATRWLNSTVAWNWWPATCAAPNPASGRPAWRTTRPKKRPT